MEKTSELLLQNDIMAYWMASEDHVENFMSSEWHLFEEGNI